MIPGLAKKENETVSSVFRKFRDITEVVIFGSRAMGNFKAGSDVDLALKGNIDETVRARVSNELNEETTLPYKFDIIIYDQIESAELKEHVDRLGKVTYQKYCASNRRCSDIA
ncbi:MAG: nucleotidyltransferase domain-containing protein [Pseudomonadota bacterium]